MNPWLLAAAYIIACGALSAAIRRQMGIAHRAELELCHRMRAHRDDLEHGLIENLDDDDETHWL